MKEIFFLAATSAEERKKEKSLNDFNCLSLIGICEDSGDRLTVS